ncbi:UDP-N-acetylglucosamine 2-epimerase (non-hydrolyzing) [Spelaeicoccus albus]|uniref:UDP-N-acetylglucosamine 2-epimerase (non-hydrolyzing) n=2 Tax=Spelaeicoccus albus TaxID=1280376 RepID=A0A7Z0A8U9_9MICO|nr:UDP-N-acetylglucosamine 2-epimerase (non-hydrolyzing) [Spelaeicoccus albus]
MPERAAPLIMPIYGTRPEAVKMAPLIALLREGPELDVFVTVTGQHREMLDQVNDLFGIAGDHDLNIHSPRQTLSAITAKALAGLSSLFATVRPDAVVVQGNTGTSTAAALAAFYEKIPVVHLEAGLRSGHRYSPFPEEINRKVTTQIASLHLAPTQSSRANLIREGVPDGEIVVTGNTVIDALHTVVKAPAAFTAPELRAAIRRDGPLLLVTTHRRENYGDAMSNVGRALRQLAAERPELRIVFPAHRSPVMREAMLPHLENLSNVTVVEPLDYREFTHLLAESTIVLTDSGGVQEEAPSLGKPVLVMRDSTERPEAVEAGTVKLIGTDRERIVKEVSQLLDDPDAYAEMSKAANPYGDGFAAPRCAAAIAEYLGVGSRMADFNHSVTE